ncbi:MAG TPA: glycosyltransferase [Thermoanaerobaculaceae bacterium]|nr:glycosyltransferase [Thermoanaerobaculaceae bacterium]
MADYAAELLPHLSAAAEVTVLEPPDWEPPADAPWLAGVARARWDAPAPAGACALLHIGNNPYHLWVARRLRTSGGMVVLHDSVLHHLLVEEAAADGAWPRFAGELERAHGAAGAAIAAAREWGYAGPLDPFLLPARQVYLSHASAVIVHNERAARDVRAACPGLPVVTVPLAVGALPAGDRRSWRRRLGVERDELLAVHLGFLTAAKGLDTILRALAAAAELGVAARLVVVGEGREREAFDALVGAAGLGERVLVWGYASPGDLGGILAAADLGLVPRYPTAGETSAAVLRFLAAGTPVAVAGYGQFLEFPEQAALRIAPGRAGVADLVRAMAWLGGDRSARRGARAAARQAWEDGGHEPARAAGKLLAAVAELAGDVA